MNEEIRSLLPILRCPRTGQPLREAEAWQLAASGLPAALSTRDGCLLYPILEGLPMLRPEDAIEAVGERV